MVAQTDMHHYYNSICHMSDPSRVVMQFQFGTHSNLGTLTHLKEHKSLPLKVCTGIRLEQPSELL